MTAISFNIASHPSTLGSRASQRREASASVEVATASHLEWLKRVCKFSLTIVLLGVVAAGIVALKAAIWIPHLSH
jgi:hypothetical protein